ncbi:hypothetical protein KQI84_00540 [bacterium]|nr:hypothetical protein [bacterium]
MARKLIGLAACMILAAGFASAQVSTYTEAGLGYPVPIPVNSTTPVEGFRSYSSLNTRTGDLALANDFITEYELGTTIDGRTIYAYVIGDSDSVGVDGTIEASAAVNGTIHAREWASPEIVTRLLEYFADGYGTDPIATYLVDQNNLAMVPVLNVDGFLQTQRYPSQYIDSTDGRERRKNMNGVDEDLAGTTSDAYLGVDVNRNFPVGWANSSSNPSSSSYHGTSASSEPEAQALQALVGLLGPEPNLRFYADMHGAIPAIYIIYNGDTEVESAAAQLLGRMQNTYRAINGISNSYQTLVVYPGDEIGATDEYFSHTYNIPSYTIEYPTPRYRVPGSGPTFVLPDDEVEEVTHENIQALLLAMMYTSGPPIVEDLKVWQDANSDGEIDVGEIVYHSNWSPDSAGGTTRSRMVSTNEEVEYGKLFKVLVQFNKPMRQQVGGVPANWPGQAIGIHPTARLTLQTNDRATTTQILQPVDDGWQAVASTPSSPGFERYKYDTWMCYLDLRSVGIGETNPQSVALEITTQDLYGHELDAQPATVADFDGGWIGYEDSTGNGDSGGTDETFTLFFDYPASSVEGWQCY